MSSPDAPAAPDESARSSDTRDGSPDTDRYETFNEEQAAFINSLQAAIKQLHGEVTIFQVLNCTKQVLAGGHIVH